MSITQSGKRFILSSWLVSSVIVTAPRGFYSKEPLVSEAKAGVTTMAPYKFPVEVALALEGKVYQKAGAQGMTPAPLEIAQIAQAAKAGLNEVMKNKQFANPDYFSFQRPREVAADKPNEELRKVQNALNSLITLGIIDNNGKALQKIDANGKMKHITDEGKLNSKDPTVAAIIGLQSTARILGERQKEKHMGLFDKVTAEAALRVVEENFPIRGTATMMDVSLLPKMLKLGGKELTGEIAKRIVSRNDARIAEEGVADYYTPRDRAKIKKTKSAIDAAFKAGRYESLLELTKRLEKELSEGATRRKKIMMQAPQIDAAVLETERRSAKNAIDQYYDRIRALVESGRVGSRDAREYITLRETYYLVVNSNDKPTHEGYIKTMRQLDEKVNPLLKKYEARPAVAKPAVVGAEAKAAEEAKLAVEKEMEERVPSSKILDKYRDGMGAYSKGDYRNALQVFRALLGELANSPTRESFIAITSENAMKVIEELRAIPQDKIKAPLGARASELVGDNNSTRDNEILVTPSARSERLAIIEDFEGQMRAATNARAQGREESARNIYKHLAEIKTGELVEAVKALMIARSVTDIKSREFEGIKREYGRLSGLSPEQKEQSGRLLVQAEAKTQDMGARLREAKGYYDTGAYQAVVTQMKAILLGAPDYTELREAMPKQKLGSVPVDFRVEPNDEGEMVIKGLFVHTGSLASYKEIPLSRYNASAERKIEVEDYYYVQLAEEGGKTYIVNPNTREKRQGITFIGEAREVIDQETRERSYEVYEVKYEDGKARATGKVIAHLDSSRNLSEEDRATEEKRLRFSTKLDKKEITDALRDGDEPTFEVKRHGERTFIVPYVTVK